jgi:5-methylcytosine-specific restriction endonuclease McrA
MELSTKIYKCKCNLCDRSFESDRRRTRCQGCYTKIRRFRNKKRAIEMMGGECSICGYKFNYLNIAAFEFHHKNPEEKDFKIGQCANKSWKVVKAEIDKCVLLCSNCHGIEHSNVTIKLLREAFRFKEIKI